MSNEEEFKITVLKDGTVSNSEKEIKLNEDERIAAAHRFLAEISDSGLMIFCDQQDNTENQ